MSKLYHFLSLVFLFQVVNAQTTVSIVADKDNSIYSGFPANSNGAGQYFFVGRNSPSNGASTQRALIHFDLSQIPAGAVISAATLTLYVSKSAPAATGIELHKVTKDWGEGTSDAAGNEAQGVAATANDATWNQSLFPGTAWANPGGDFSATSSASVQTINAGISGATPINLSGANVVADVQSSITNPSSNFGWIIISSDESVEASVKRFVSRNSSATAQRPTLSVTYSVNLPVLLKSFSATAVQHDAVITWVTSTEKDNEFFEVQHSTDGNSFSTIGTVTGNGSSTIEHSYSFTDKNISRGKHFYRLKQNDQNGNFFFSSVVSLSSDRSAVLTIYPNPATTSLSVASDFALQGNEYFIISLAGQIVQKGLIGKQINVQQLSAGHYWLMVTTTSGERFKIQFVKK